MVMRLFEPVLSIQQAGQILMRLGQIGLQIQSIAKRLFRAVRVIETEARHPQVE